MAKIEVNSLEYGLKNYAKFHKSTCISESRKTKKDLVKCSLQIQFGINRKQDNTIKTKQINLF